MSEVSKAISYSVLGAPEALLVSKTIAYAVLSTERNIVISKAVAYAVLDVEEEEEGGVGPFIVFL